MLTSENINLEWILKHRAIQTYFQPIVSIRQQAVIGLEALSRGLNANNDLILPQPLFAAAAAKGKSVELDRLCREKALENYKRIPDNDSFLFLNLTTSILDEGVVGSGHLITAVNQLGLKPSSIVIEVIESKVRNIENLTKFIKLYKQYGFLIALDDVGTDSSNMDRILQVHPDIIKIDRVLICDINTDYYKQELFKALVFVAKKTGALIIAEGVETHSEATTSLELGADFLQGYYTAYPAPFPKHINSVSAKTMRLLSSAFRSSIVENIRNMSLKRKFYEKILEGLIEKLACICPEHFEMKLNEIAKDQTSVQCYYILDITGIQITETVKAYLDNTENCHGMFRPDCKGSDQSLKDYYLYIHSGFERYISEPYISLANGQPCLTGSILFQTYSGNPYILCIDFTC
ncbi:EAL domain-containing protein [Sporomusa sp. KB1]|jgi:EAL domain-containing protein (putative c-di-GMP-specific phosphodiesterase class I)|uniref:EAL domain-containing protein n=1 Tax=Sporomusa sp. KB1 TaxID=943346 RepID=UPI0011A1B3CE|nr:EAL domain-containing protein [Sporomusa sp. KB1]TWH46301.1 EAL domain-containing protein (putative c-di-GMP-specific phosphodiesterase class I) [Sporomusa sp. KB1]